MRKIIYVDDEELNLELFRLNFREHFEVFTAQSPFEAIEIIKTEHIRVIVADYKMPKMNGMQLIEKVKEIDPDSVCMILSGYLESEVITDKSKLFRYLMKPYKKEEVLIHLEQAFEVLHEKS